MKIIYRAILGISCFEAVVDTHCVREEYVILIKTTTYELLALGFGTNRRDGDKVDGGRWGAREGGRQ